MKLNTLFAKSAKLFTIVALAAMVMVGCKKDPADNPNNPDNPDNPNNPNDPVVPENEGYFVYGSDTINISFVAIQDMGGLYVLAFDLANGAQFSTLGTINPVDAGTMPFSDFMTILFGGQGIYGSYMIGEDADDVESGTIEVKTVGEKSEINIEGTTMAGKSVKAYFKGTLIDLSKPTGNGTLTWNGNNYDINIAAVMTDQGLFDYELTNTQMSLYTDIIAIAPLTTGTYTITNDEADFNFNGNNQMVGVNIEILDETGESDLLDVSATYGSLNVTYSGKTFTISMDAYSSQGQITANYTGSIYTLYAAKMMQKARKMLKK